MENWKAILPGGTSLWLESDHPREDLEKMGSKYITLVKVETAMRWQVKLPGEKSLWLESNHPHEALEKMGYTEYALTDMRILPKHKIPRKIKWTIA